MPWAYPECKKCGGLGLTDPWLDPAPCGACDETGYDRFSNKIWVNPDKLSEAVKVARGGEPHGSY